MNVLTVTATFNGGGAEKIARTIMYALRDRGIPSHMRTMAGRPVPGGPAVSCTPFDYGSMGLFRKADHYLRSKAQTFGLEQCASQASAHILERLPFVPDLIHAHILRGDLLRIEDLKRLCSFAPVIWTLHDMWAFTGHCAHSFDCTRWQTGCGKCPHLDIYVPLRHDVSAINLRRRRRTYRFIENNLPGRLHLVCPSRWLLGLVEKSIAGRLPLHVIYNGIDTGTFRPLPDEKRAMIRRELGLPPDAFVVLFAAHGGSGNPFKDYAAFTAASELLQAECSTYCFAAAGDTAAGHDGRHNIHLLGSADDCAGMAELYACADLFVHAARAEVFGLTAVEAMACGVPVIATRTGGLPEVIDDGVSGILVDPSDPPALARAIAGIRADRERYGRLRSEGLKVARTRFTAERAVDQYTGLYRRILEKNT